MSMERTTAPGSAARERELAPVETRGGTIQAPIRRLIALHGLVGNQAVGLLLRAVAARSSVAAGAVMHIQRKLSQVSEQNSEQNFQQLRGDRSLTEIREQLFTYYAAGTGPDDEMGPLGVLRDLCKSWLDSADATRLAEHADESMRNLHAFVAALHLDAEKEHLRLEKVPRGPGLRAQDIPLTADEQTALGRIGKHLAQADIHQLVTDSPVGALVNGAQFPRIRRVIHENAESFARVYVEHGMAIFIRDQPKATDAERDAERDTEQKRLAAAANGTEALTIEDKKTQAPVIHLQRTVGDAVTAVHETMHALTSPKFKDSPFFSVNLNEGLAEAMALAVARKHNLTTTGTYAAELAPVTAAIERIGFDVVARLYFQGDNDGFVAAFDKSVEPGAAKRWFGHLRAQPGLATQMLAAPAAPAPAQ
jgi:hypothetical protein